MKRIYIIGAALLLLAIVAADFYIKDNRKENVDGVAKQTSLPVNEVITSGGASDNTPANNTPADNSATNGNNTAVAAATRTATRYHRRQRHNSRAEVTGNIYENPSPETEGAIVINVNNVNNEIGVERSKDYLGHRKVGRSGSYDENTRHGGFRMPENVGIEIGYNQSSLGNNQTSNIPVSSANVGLLYNFSLGDNFAFQPGIRYISRGNSLQNEMDVDNKEKLKPHYLEVPANLVVKIGKVGNARLMIGAGPYVAYLVAAKDKFWAQGYSEGSDVIATATPQYSTANINKLDWGMGGFVGLQSPDGFFVKAGGEAGMSDIIKNTDGTYSNRNYSMMISLGFIMGDKL
jgi:hypothetical protein